MQFQVAVRSSDDVSQQKKKRRAGRQQKMNNKENMQIAIRNISTLQKR